MTAPHSHSDHSRRNPPLQPRENPGRLPYPSDIDERQWSSIWPLLQHNPSIGRPRRHSLREIVDAINYRWHTGCVWRMLPHDFPPWRTVYDHFHRWERRGLLRKIRDAVLFHSKCAQPAEIEPTAEGAEWTVQGGDCASPAADFPAQPH